MIPSRVVIEPDFGRELARRSDRERKQVTKVLGDWQSRGCGRLCLHKNPASAAKFSFNATLRAGTLWRITLLHDGHGTWRVTGLLRRDDRRIYL